MMRIESVSVLAGVLSKKYNVQVKVSGTVAFSTIDSHGKPFINVPALESEEPEYMDKLRGFIDHEVGHIRFTDFQYQADAVTSAAGGMPIMMKSIWNALEDTFVERKMGEVYIGCRSNLSKLVRIVFSEHLSMENNFNLNSDGTATDDFCGIDVLNVIFNYILYAQRNRAYPFLHDFMQERRDLVEHLVPGLADKIDAVMDEAWPHNNSTQENLEWARKILEVLKAEKPVEESLKSESHKKNARRRLVQSKEDTGATQEEIVEDALESISILEDDVSGSSSTSIDSVLNSRKAITGSILCSVVDSHASHCEVSIIETARDGFCNTMSPDMQIKAKRITNRLASQIQALMQTWVMNRGGAFRRGRLDSRKLARLAVNDQRIFEQRVEQRSINTEVIILCDMSGSMQGVKAATLSEGLYALTHALAPIRGVKLGAYGFSSDRFVPILNIGEKVHNKMYLNCSGGTYCGEMSLAALSKFSWKPDTRRIFIVMTDGETDNEELFNLALNRARQAGVEIVGVGIESYSIAKYVTTDELVLINDTMELPSKLFGILRDKLIRKGL